MTPQYYKAVLREDWPGIEQYIEFFQTRCDSQLEVLFALALITEYRQGGFNYNGDLDGWTHIRESAVALMEPFSSSPSQNGASIAYLQPQVPHGGYVWDFGIFTGNDNGADFDACKLSWLIEIDGWAVHRGQREWDESKCRLAKVRVIRVCEEKFVDVREMADSVLLATIWNDNPENTPRETKLQFGGHDY